MADASEQTLTVTSTLFSDGEPIPSSAAHGSVGGDNISPDLRWSAVPAGTASLAVTCHDPDAPTGVGWVHWILTGIDPTARELERGAGDPRKAPSGAVHGFTDYGESCYGGMAPPEGDPPHHYHFTVWALDVADIGADATTSYAKFRMKIRGHVLAQGTLTGLYSIPG